MSFFASSSYKPQVRQEGFHLPSPTSPTSTNPPSPPSSTSVNAFDSANHQNSLYMPQTFVPDAFRKYPAGSADTGGSGGMDFTDSELASLMAHSPAPNGQHHGHTHHHHQSSHERTTHSPHPSGDGGYDDGYRSTHTMFDMTAPHHNAHSTGFPAHFSLPAHRSSENPLSQPSSLHHPQHVHDFSATPHSHFNSTLPALNSSMRFDPHPHDIPPPSSFTYPVGVPQSEYRAQQRHTPSPIGTSRSRSRSRAPSVGPTRHGRPRRNTSVSSTSPPPLSARPSAIVIPGAHRHLNGNGNGVPVSPLSLHSLSGSTGGWFMPPHGHSTNEYNLPTPESITNPFGSSFASATSQAQNLGISPSDVTSLTTLKDRTSSTSLKEEKSGDPVTKQAILANEKRRRRRESHNAVERRRRDNINEKISELATLIPECMLDPSATVGSPTATEDTFNPLTTPIGEAPSVGKRDLSDDPATPMEPGVVKANKGMILRKSVEYIRYLQQLVSAQATRNRELEQALHGFRGDDGNMGKHELSLNMNGIGHNSNGNGIHTPTSNDSPRPHSHGVNGHDDMHGLMLHEEVGADGFGMGNMSYPLGFASMPQGKNGFHGFELASMPEDSEMDDRPMTGVTMSGTSPSVGSADDDTRLSEEEDRGRRGRDGRLRDGVTKFEELSASRERPMVKAMDS